MVAMVLFVPAACLAQEALEPLTADYAHYVRVEDENVRHGHLVSLVENEYRLSTKPYDSDLTGVVLEKPTVAINTVGHDNTYPIADTDVAQVLVSGEGGSLKAGDSITSSDKPGVAIKADRPGYIVGKVLEDYEFEDPSETKLVKTMLMFAWADIEMALSDGASLPQQLMKRLSYGLNLSKFAAMEEPSTVLKYAIAILVLLFSFIFGVFIFGRIATNGIRAMGRNPLAKKSIGFTVFLNVFIAIVVTVGGLVIAVLIITV